MSKDPTRSSSGSVRLAVIIVSAVMAVLIGLFVLALVLLGGSSEMESKEYILSHLDESIKENTENGSANVTPFLDGAGFGGYDRRKFRRVENYFRLYYPLQLPSPAELARLTVKVFFEEEYDSIDPEDEDQLTDALIRSYLAATDDTWAKYRTPEEYEIYEEDMSGQIVGIGVNVSFPDGIHPRVELVVEGSPAEEAGILKWDVITHVDGVPVEELGGDKLVSAIRGEEGTTVDITVKRGTEELTVTVTRRQFEDITVSWKMLEGDIAYMLITQFKANTDELFIEAIDQIEGSGAVGIIFDLRSNPGGYLDSVVNALSYLVPEGTDVVSFKYKTESENTVYTATGDHVLTLPCTVLCNEDTASAGELFTAAIRDYTAMGLIDSLTVGEKTYGKGVMQSTFELGGGSTLTMTVALYNPPSGVNYEGIGIDPDVDVSNIEDDTTDYQLGRAIEELWKLIALQSGGIAA